MKLPVNRTLLNHLDHWCPPFMAYYLAGVMSGQKWPGVDGIVKATGIPKRTVIRVAAMTSWKGVKCGVASAFLDGCGIDPMELKLAKNYFRREMEKDRPFHHLSDPMYRMFNAKCEVWRRQMKEREQ